MFKTFIARATGWIAVAVIALIAATVGYLSWQNGILRQEISALVASNHALDIELQNVTKIANDNAASLRRADFQRNLQITAITSDIAEYKARLDAVAADNAAADLEEDGPLAPVLKNWRQP